MSANYSNTAGGILIANEQELMKKLLGIAGLGGSRMTSKVSAGAEAAGAEAAGAEGAGAEGAGAEAVDGKADYDRQADEEIGYGTLCNREVTICNREVPKKHPTPTRRGDPGFRVPPMDLGDPAAKCSGDTIGVFSFSIRNGDPRGNSGSCHAGSARFLDYRKHHGPKTVLFDPTLHDGTAPTTTSRNASPISP